MSLDAISKDKKIELLNFYEDKIRKVRFSRSSVVRDKDNYDRGQKLLASLLKKQDPDAEQILRNTQKHLLTNEV